MVFIYCPHPHRSLEPFQLDKITTVHRIVYFISHWKSAKALFRKYRPQGPRSSFVVILFEKQPSLEGVRPGAFQVASQYS